MTTHPLPKLDELNSVLSMLYSPDVGMTPLDDPIESGEFSHFGCLLDDDDNPVAGVACDLAFAAYAGAALSMIPKAGADDAVQEGEITDMMLGNLNEFVNICSRWFMRSDTPHVRLDRTCATSELSDDAKIILEVNDRIDLSVDIPNYGTGRLICLTT